MSQTERPASVQPAAGGYARRFERRPEFRLFGKLVNEVIDASSVRERAVDDLKVFRIRDVFAGADEIFMGFGKPNAYLVVPGESGGYVKFAGKSLKRAPSVVQDTRGLVQSGILIRFTNLPPHAAQKLREAMQIHNGVRFWTCVNACLHVMADAGFGVSRGAPLKNRYWPYAVLSALIDGELTFEGRKVEYEVVRTSGDRLQRYAFNIIKAEALTFCRHTDRAMQGRAKKSKAIGAFWGLVTLPLRLFGYGKHTSSGKVNAPVAPALPEDVEYCSDITVRLSRSSLLGALLRQIWGPHTLFEATQPRVEVGDYLTKTLNAFPQPNPSFVTRLKKRLLFSRPVIWLIRRVLAPSYIDIGSRSEEQIYDMLRTDSPESPNKYNLVITRKRLIIARINVAQKLIDWILSKHVLMSGYDPEVVFAGEVWKDAEGVIHVSRNSGTYQPTEAEHDLAVALVQAIFPHLKVVKD